MTEPPWSNNKSKTTYVAGMLRVLGVRPVPFVLSFTIYFIALHMTEALFMRRLFLRAEAR